ncbi:MAG: SGNH/GDSL hydrolase family protein, partial [Candidatus Sumerlaeaceae bacterium]|nr:SGNH/GDSL hydrolase family protein [Candidatus Sumerlaeaceae bacterium]
MSRKRKSPRASQSEMGDNYRELSPVEPVLRKPLSKGKMVVFTLITVLLLLGFLEAFLRVAGFGGVPRLFVPVLEMGQQKIYRSSNDALWLYFGNKFKGGAQLVGSTVPERIAMPKPPGVVRVFLLGESTVQGFPFPPNLAAASFLQRFLQQRMPEGRNVEVINVGITAVASFPLRYVADEVLKFSPDLLVLYAGHNEYFGAFGVASTQGVGTRPWQMALALAIRTTGLYNAILSVVRKLPAADQANEMTGRSGLMAMMSAKELIGPKDPLRKLAEESLSANIGYITQAAKRASVRIIICSLTSNLRDLPPIRNIEPSDANSDEWRAEYVQAEALATSAPVEALERLRKAARLEPDHAATRFLLARVLEAAGKTTESLTEFQAARDADAMPWRATTQFNKVLRNIANSENVPFCDVDAAFLTDSGGPPGWGYFVDHLHPSLQGQAVMAWAISECIGQSKSLELKDIPKPKWQDTGRKLGDNRLTEWNVARRMTSLFGGPPLDSDKASARFWSDQTRQLMEGAAPFEKRAMESYNAALAQGSVGPTIPFFGGQEALKDSLFREAAGYFRCAEFEAMPFTPERLISGYYFRYSRFRGRS